MKLSLYTSVVAVALFVAGFHSPALADSFGSGANQFNVEFVPIGDPDNPDDTTGNPSTAGKVVYPYRIGKFEVSRDMITKANTEGGLGITLADMNGFVGGNGVNQPATHITWFEAAQFVNWLNTSEGHQAAYNFDGGGNFQLWSSGQAWQTGGENLFRHKDAFYFLPSMDEWYKAAYYDPDSDTYFDFPTGSDSTPDGINFVLDPNFDAVFNDNGGQPGPNAIDNAGLLSPFGTMGQGGNVWEWEETALDLVNSSASEGRTVRGGSWGDHAGYMASLGRFNGTPTNSFFHTGFRVASVPEPSSLMLAALGLIGFFLRQGMRKGR